MDRRGIYRGAPFFASCSSSSWPRRAKGRAEQRQRAAVKSKLQALSPEQRSYIVDLANRGRIDLWTGGAETAIDAELWWKYGLPERVRELERERAAGPFEPAGQARRDSS